MTQNIYDLSQLKAYLKKYPNASNNDLYDLCSATTKSQKSSVRKKKQRLLVINSDTDPNEKIASLTPDSVEKLIIDKLNNKSTIPDAHIRMALDHVIKLKITSDEVDENIDMEALKQIGITSTSGR